jgi:hypothetical protein
MRSQDTLSVEKELERSEVLTIGGSRTNGTNSSDMRVWPD